ncbi:sugar ABC transporter substrate-binding protein [Nocardiopsis tropica]|jgi:N,N'-diacetylchitobiose transport system substrate-binding protein|uniref:Sugar ABC transporter substrate-binding protein n=1 Tax=Nocardiopsis tropica TaxID=109330 RepID=A0ABU7KSG7_9ACTN|nr:sugar ABC transporter substrate-binding protein [Nocardiopsis umidischolae]MEE2052012.1 sugar ABC transporter substrate-binding protein [Nocardiopsis umidischolae]
MARRRTHKYVPLPAAAVALVLAATACGSGGGGGGSAADGLTVWIMQGTNPDETGFFEEANAAFTEETGVEVDVEFIPWQDAQNKISTAIAGGTTPDVVELGNTLTPGFADAGALHDLSGYDIDTDQYIPGLMEMGRLGDGVYGVPWYASIRSVVYRSDIFEEHGLEVPENWEELRETATALAEAEDGMIAFPVPGDAQYSVMPWIWGGGGEIAVEQPDGTWVSEIDTPEGRAGIEFFTGLALEDGTSTTGAVNWTEIEVMESIANEEAAMAILGSANPKAILESNPGLEGRIDSFTLPGQEEGYMPSFAGGSLLSVFEGTGNEEAAWQYVQHLTGDEFSMQWSEETGFFPGVTAKVEEFSESADPILGPFAVQLNEASRGVPVTPAWTQVEAEKLLVGMQQSILNGEASVDEATADTAAEIERILNGG